VKRFIATLLAGSLFLFGCSSPAGDPDASPTTLFPPTTTDVVTTTVAPTATIASVVLEEVPLADHAIPNYATVDDTFSFENFGGGEAPADLTVNMARRLYGDNQVCSDVTDGQCTPYPVILQLMSQANKSMRGGLCEGLAVLSLRLAGDIETLATFQNTQTVAELIKQDPALLSEIAYWYVTQFAMEVQQEASSYLEKSPTELAEVLLYDFSEAEKGNPHTGFTIGIYSEMGGHAVTPYRVEEMAGGYRIHIYDSNWPNEERWIDVSNDGQWMYALAATNPTEQSEAWFGGTGTMELTPMRSRSGPFTCSFCPQEEGEESGTMLTVAASGDKQMALKIETESGDRLGYYDGAFVNEIEGATYRYLISGPSTADPVLVFLPPGVESFSADVEEIDVPTPEVEEPTSTRDRIEEAIEEQIEEETEQKFSLLVLSEEKSVQIEAVIVEEEEPERWEEAEEEVEEEPEEAQSLLAFSEESIEIAEIEEATVAIAVDALEVEIELEAGQQIEVAFAPEPEPEPEQPGVTIPESEPVRDTLDIAIQDEAGEVLAEVEVDMTAYRVVEQVFDEPTVTIPDRPDAPAATLPPAPEPVIVPVVIELTFDVDVGEITVEEVEVEAWVASDAEYFQAVAEDRIEEVLGASYVEEIESVEEWEAPEIFEEDEIDFVEILLSVDEEYWEDEQWEEVEYDDEYFEEEQELMDDLFGEAVDVEELFEEVESFMEEVEEERIEFFEEHEEFDEEEFWEEYEEEYYEEDFAFQEYDADLEEAWILEEMGLEEWNEDLMGPSPTETVDWEEEDWDIYDEEMDAIWEEEMEDPESWEEELLEELGVEEWPEDWGPSPTESAEWTEDDWDAYDQEWAADEEAMILAEEGFDEWPEDWGPSPSETALWDDGDWEAYDAEQELLWEVNDEEDDEWSLDEDSDLSLEEDWSDEDWMEEEDENVSEDDLWLEEDDEWGNWSAEDEEAWILEEEGLEEWPEDWGPPPSETWEWTEEDWQEYDEEMEAQWEEDWEDMTEEWTEEEWDDWNEFTGEDVDDLEEPELWDDEEDPFTDPEDTGTFDEELLPEPDSPSEEEVDEEQVDEAEVPSEEVDEPEIEETDEPEVEEPEVEEGCSDTDWCEEPPWDEEIEEDPDWEVEDPDWDPDWEPEEPDVCDAESWCEEEPWDEEPWDEEEDPYWDEEVVPWPDEDSPDICDEHWCELQPEEPPEEPVVEEPEPVVPEPSWDPYEGCRGTDACSMAPGGFTSWEAYDAANDPNYYDDWGTPPGGYVTWVDFTVEVEAGIVDAEVAEEYLPEEVQETYIPPPAPVYVPTYTYTNTAVSLQETISTSSSTAQTGTATTTNVTTSESGILTHNSNDGHWHLDTTTVTTTATTVTNTLVDTTTVVARTGTDFVSCLMIDGIQQSGGCSTQRSWNDNETTATVGDAYTEATTTTASASATVGTEEGCAEGGWRGMGDWCIVSSTSRTNYDYVQFTLDEPTSIRIDAETNLTRAQFNTNNEAADPYIYLNWDTHAPEGDHSGDASAVGVGQQIESDDDGGNDCGNTCVNPPSTAVDVDETPTITYCDTGGACSDGVPVIDNVSDQWDSRIVRTNQAAGDYVVRASVYNGNNSGWYRLTIEEVE